MASPLAIMNLQKSMVGLGAASGTILDTFMKGIKALMGFIPGRQVLDAVLGPLKKVFSGEMLDEVLKFQQQFNKASVSMGYSAKNAKLMHTQLYNIGQTAKVSTEKAGEVVNALLNTKVPAEMISELGDTTAKFSSFAGVAADEAGRFAGNMVRFGASSKQVKEMFTSLGRVQQGMGLSEEGMSDVVQSSGEVISNLQSMGAEFNVLNKTIEAMGKLAASFEHAGLSARRAGELMNGLMNPKNFSSNVVLLNRLGVSAQQYADILAGNKPLDENMNKKLAQMGKQVKDLLKKSPMAAQAMADAWTGGQISVQEFVRMANQQNKSEPTKDRFATMWGKSMNTVKDQIDNLKNLFDNFWKGMVAKLLPDIEKLVQVLVKFVMQIPWGKIATIISDLQTGVMRIMNALLTAIEKNDWNDFGNVIKQETKKFMQNTLPKIQSLIAGMVSALAPMLKKLVGNFQGILANAGLDPTMMMGILITFNNMAILATSDKDIKYKFRIANANIASEISQEKTRQEANKKLKKEMKELKDLGAINYQSVKNLGEEKFNKSFGYAGQADFNTKELLHYAEDLGLDEKFGSGDKKKTLIDIVGKMNISDYAKQRLIEELDNKWHGQNIFKDEKLLELMSLNEDYLYYGKTKYEKALEYLAEQETMNVKEMTLNYQSLTGDKKQGGEAKAAAWGFNSKSVDDTKKIEKDLNQQEYEETMKKQETAEKIRKFLESKNDSTPVKRK